jgi:hypothetical protein
MKKFMKSLIFAAAILTSTHAFASPVELFLGTWEGKAQTGSGQSCSVTVVMSGEVDESLLVLSHSLRCDESPAVDHGQKWFLRLRADGVIGPEGVDSEHLPPATWTRTEIRFLDAQTQESLQLKRSNPMLDVVPYLQYNYTDGRATETFQVTGMLTKTK